MAEKRRFRGRIGFTLIPEMWRETVGDGIADHTRPLRLSRKTLTISVDSSAWMNELQYSIPAMIEKLNARLGQGKVKGIRMKLADPSRCVETETPPDISRELDEREEGKASRIAMGIRDSNLRDSISRAYRKSLLIRKFDAVHGWKRKPAAGLETDESLGNDRDKDLDGDLSED